MNLRQSRAEETHTSLLEAAAECFAQHGYDAASVAEICRCAGVSKGAFYHHFSSKQALFLELLDAWLAKLDTQLDAARLGAPTIPEGIRRMVETARPVFEMSDAYFPIFLEFLTRASREPAVWRATIEPYRRYSAFFTRLIEAGIEEGSLRRVDAEMAAQVLVSLAVGLLLQGLLDPEGTEWGQVALEGVQMLLEGLETEGEQCTSSSLPNR